eukprot:c5745_g1_i1.p1 GENE.c5745_g1_i1~~c5745_g1_i1.p1  ORF type:complete len:170 (+),score=40.42 c5745_g1_i1:1-510(+)
MGGISTDVICHMRRRREEVMAFAKLVGEHFEFHMVEYPLVVGRRSASDPAAHVHLGDSKSISRKHASIDWNKEKKLFEIQCLGKNGMTVDGTQVLPKDGPVSLQNKTKILIGDVTFYFLLPLNASSKLPRTIAPPPSLPTTVAQTSVPAATTTPTTPATPRMKTEVDGS